MLVIPAALEAKAEGSQVSGVLGCVSFFTPLWPCLPCHDVLDPGTVHWNKLFLMLLLPGNFSIEAKVTTTEGK